MEVVEAQYQNHEHSKGEQVFIIPQGLELILLGSLSKVQGPEALLVGF